MLSIVESTYMMDTLDTQYNRGSYAVKIWLQTGIDFQKYSLSLSTSSSLSPHLIFVSQMHNDRNPRPTKPSAFIIDIGRENTEISV